MFPNFISRERCDHIVKLARGKLQASGLAWRPDETPDPDQETRTSDGTFIEASEDAEGVLAWLEEKIAAVTMLPPHHGEVGRGGAGEAGSLGRACCGAPAAERPGPGSGKPVAPGRV
jgi:hypothetical protein